MLQRVECACGETRHWIYVGCSPSKITAICAGCGTPSVEISFDPKKVEVAGGQTHDEECAAGEAIRRRYETRSPTRQPAPSDADRDEAMGSARDEPADVGAAPEGVQVKKLGRPLKYTGQKPWEAEGISKAGYYKRKKKGKAE